MGEGFGIAEQSPTFHNCGSDDNFTYLHQVFVLMNFLLILRLKCTKFNFGRPGSGKGRRESKGVKKWKEEKIGVGVALPL